jgi:FkbM family methyltransferase
VDLIRKPIGIAKDLLRSVGIDLVKYDMYHSEDVLLHKILKNFNVNTILDVGANEGQYASQVIKQGYTGKIYSFEPISTVYNSLEKKAAISPQWSAFKLGVGSREEETMINVSENFVSSSIFKVNNESISANPQTKIVRQEKIKITTIDDFFDSKGPFDKNVMLKLDIQGFELEALKGAIKSMPGIKLIQSELSFVKIYDNIPLFGEVVQFLEKNGYEVFTIIPGFRDNKTGRMFQADGVFVRFDL